MNTLAHFALGYPVADLMLGQFLGDHVKGPVLESPFPAVVQQGIRAHRRVDAAGDQHDFTRFAKSLLPSHQKRYAGVVLDVYSDYLLILVWDQVMEEPLPSVLSDIHDLLRTPLLPLPPTAARTASALLNYRILESYADADNLPGMVDRIGTRLRRPVSLSSLLFSLQRHEPELLDRFIDYYADMQQVANP